MDTTLVGGELKKIVNSQRFSLNLWFSVLMNITVQTCYCFQYITIKLGGYMNSPTEPYFLSLRQGLEYLMHHPHEPIKYSRNEIFKQN